MIQIYPRSYKYLVVHNTLKIKFFGMTGREDID